MQSDQRLCCFLSPGVGPKDSSCIKLRLYRDFLFTDILGHLLLGVSRNGKSEIIPVYFPSNYMANSASPDHSVL